MDNKEYFLAVPADEVHKIADALNKLYGYIIAERDRQSDPQTGMPHSNTAVLFSEIQMPLNKLTTALSRSSFQVRDINKLAEGTRKDLARDVLNAISNSTSELTLLTSIADAINNYEIIGKEKHSGSSDEDIPF